MYSRVSSLQITRKSSISLQAFVFGHLLTGKFANLSEYCTNLGARGGAVGWGTALQTGWSRVRFPMVSLDFFIDIILPAALWFWGRPSL